MDTGYDIVFQRHLDIILVVDVIVLTYSGEDCVYRTDWVLKISVGEKYSCVGQMFQPPTTLEVKWSAS